MKSNVISAVALGLTLALALPACNVMRGQETAGQYVDDVTITSKVKAELLDSKKVDGLDVNVDVNKGRVTLSGWATSSAERSKATSLARAVQGVRSVDNQIKIKS
jgi:hyperosmotically inducible protein